MKFNWLPARELSNHKIYELCKPDSSVGVDEFVQLLTHRCGQFRVCMSSESEVEYSNRHNKNLYTVFRDMDVLESEQEKCEMISLPEVDVCIGEIKLRGLIDSGSEVTCMRQECYERVKENLNQLAEIPIPSIRIAGAFGQSKGNLNKLVMIPIGIGQCIIDTPTLILKHLPKEIILGFDFMQLAQGSLVCTDKI